MESPVVFYQSQLQLITDRCADPWFAVQLSLSRAGDGAALRRISGSCLNLVFQIAKQKWQPDCSLPLLDLVQEGSCVLMQTIEGFQGSTAVDFLSELTKHVDCWLTLVVQHPDLLPDDS